MALKNTHSAHSQQNALIAHQVIEMLERIKFGSIEIVIHDNKVVQIERKEKIRPDVLGK